KEKLVEIRNEKLIKNHREKGTSNVVNEDKIESLREGMQWLVDRFPDVQVDMVQGLIDNVADGRYSIVQDLIQLSEEYATKEVVKEEAFHKAFHSVSISTRKELLEEGSKRFNIKLNGTLANEIMI